ncbi:MAG TPA: phosphoglycerate kinase [Thermoplasmata archaeon]|nr:phosphoglycerate kinase [Thermoplasmata archaeon]
MGRKRAVTAAAVEGRRVLVRADFNVPQNDRGEIADDRRILEALDTLRYLRERGARVVVMSHLGRPRGKPDVRWSLRPIAERLSGYLGQPVPLLEAPTGPETLAKVRNLRDGEFALLENLRFDPGEEANDPGFAAALAALGEIFVEEAFGTVHRAHASTVGVAQHLPAYAGFLVEREVEELSKLLGRPEAPFVALLGGAKVADKLPLLRSLPGRVDRILLGGALAFPFLSADGADLGATAVEGGLDDAVREVRRLARDRGTELVLPEDLLVDVPGRRDALASSARQVPAGAVARDIGPRTRDRFYERLSDSRTVFWNGPLGLAEDPRYSAGTREVLAGLLTLPGYHVCAGGDSARIAEDLGVVGAFQFISTGGGAALEFLEGRELPGLAVIPDA